MVKVVFMGVLLAHSLYGLSEEPCTGASTSLSPSARKTFARSIASNLTKWQPPTQIKVQQVLSIGNWTAVWATPSGMERGVFFYSQEKDGLVYHDVWGGYAAPSDQEGIVQWVMKLSPSVQKSFAECFAGMVTAGH